MELFKLFGTVLIEDQDAIKALKNVDNKGKETKTSLQEIADKGVKIGAAVVAGTGAAIGGLMALANTTADSADKWDKLSLRTGIAVEELQRWGYAAGQSGADITVLETGMKKLSDTMVDAQNGSKTAKSAYEQLGISLADLATMTPEQAFESVMNALGDMEDGALKNSIGNDLLGKSYVELKPLLAEGSEGMQALKDRADELGIVMSEDAVGAGVVFGDTLADAKSSLDGVKNKIVADLLPQLTKMLEWFLGKMPQIQSVAGSALGFVSDVIGFIADNSNILIPVLGGLLGAFISLKMISVVNGLMAAYTAFTTTATGVQMGLNAALMANPIGLVIAAITALIAIGIALYMNWDKIKEKAGELWNGLKEKWEGIKKATSEAWGKVKDAMSNAMNAAKDTVKEKLNNIKSAYEENGGGIKGIAAAAMEGIKGYYSAGLTFIDKLTGGKLTDIKNSFLNKFESVKNIVSNAIEKIKGFLNFKWEFPKLKMPHFSISGSMNPLKWIDEGVPKISVDWYAKGGIFSKPTIFNTPYGLKGVGDAKSPEVVAPLHELNGMISEGILKTLEPLLTKLQSESPEHVTKVYLDTELWGTYVNKRIEEAFE